MVQGYLFLLVFCGWLVETFSEMIDKIGEFANGFVATLRLQFNHHYLIHHIYVPSQQSLAITIAVYLSASPLIESLNIKIF